MGFVSDDLIVGDVGHLFDILSFERYFFRADADAFANFAVEGGFHILGGAYFLSEPFAAFEHCLIELLMFLLIVYYSREG